MRADTERAGISVSAPVLTRDGLVPVARFLLDCAAAIAGTPTDEQLAFVHAGRRALLAGQRWVQFEQVLTHRPETWRYVELRDLATRLLGDGLVTEFFFMHKPPGLRFRFEPAAGRRDELIAAVRAWHGQDVARMSCYEPETALFGGPVAMHHVHRLFTVDSLLWLDHHIDPAEPAWAHSLSVLAALLSGLGVVDWEDLDVWDRVRSQLRRGLSPEITRSADFRAAAAGVRTAWAERRATDAHERVRELARAWRTGYFDTEHAELGPREDAALVTIFHWNRGALSPLRQGLLAEALADRTATGAPS